MTDRDYICAFDLDGKDTTVTIARVVAGELTAAGGRKAKKPVVFFEGGQKGLALNATNCKTIAGMYGHYTEKWIGQKITLWPTITQMGSETMECIRVRPTIPTGKASKASAASLSQQIAEKMAEEATPTKDGE